MEMDELMKVALSATHRRLIFLLLLQVASPLPHQPVVFVVVHCLLTQAQHHRLICDINSQAQHVQTASHLLVI